MIPRKVKAAFGVLLTFLVLTWLAIPSLADIGNMIVNSIYHALRPSLAGEAARTLDYTFNIWLLAYAVITIIGILSVLAAIRTITRWVTR